MSSKYTHQQFERNELRRSQSLCNESCQNILYKAVFEHFKELSNIGAVLLASKSIQNSSFGANFLVNFVVDYYSIGLLDAVLSPSSCFSVQFVPSLHIKLSWVNRSISNFIGELLKTKYFHLSLRSLTLRYVSNEILSSFFGSSCNAWPQLQDLSLENCLLEDNALKIIAKNAIHLRTANFSGSSGITTVGLESIAKLSCITSLNLSGCDDITDVGFEFISDLSSITSLNLTDCHKITDVGLEHVAKLTSIATLDLTNCELITDAGIVHISKLSSITSLNLDSCTKITDASIEHLSELSNISSLNLSRCKLITGDGLLHLSKLSRITSLDLRCNNKLTDVGLAHIAQLANITSLNLDVSGCRLITDAGLQHLSNHSRIASLHITGCESRLDCKG